MSESVILIGGSGHARVIMDCLAACGKAVAGILDDGIAPGTLVQGVPVLGSVADASRFHDHGFVIAIGNNAVRHRIAQNCAVRWITVIHPAATVSPYARLGEGTVVLPGAVINSGAKLGAHCIINSGAVVEHDCLLEDFVHISPNAALGGTVCVGAQTHIGIGACVRNNLRICEDCIVGAGAAVVKDITKPGIYAGIPARRLR